MDCGVFLEFERRDDDGVSMRDGLALAQLAEARGLDSVWLAEFHFTPDRSVLSSPMTVAAAIAAVTKTIRIGTAIYVLPLNHPLRIAEEVATLDQLSDGRVDFGVGRSGFSYFYQAYGVPYDESRARFDECLDVVRQALRQERISFAGDFYRIDDVAVVPRPRQQPVPVRIAATSPSTFRRVGEDGAPIFIGLRGDGLDELAASIALYRDAFRGADHATEPSVFLRLPVYVEEDEASAVATLRPHLEYYFERQAQLLKGDTAGMDAKRRDLADNLESLSVDEVLATRAVVGSPASVVDALLAIDAALGLDGVIAELNPGGGLAHEQVEASLRLFADAVAPKLRKTKQQY